MNTEKLEKLFEESKKDETLRQGLINEIVKSDILKDEKQYISQMLYYPEKNKRVMGTFYLAKNSIIKIYSLAFSDSQHPVFEDFIGTLKHHEGVHAKLYHQKVEANIPVSIKLLDRVEEDMQAYENQMKNITDKNSDVYIKDIDKSYECHKTVKDLAKTLLKVGVNPEKIENIIRSQLIGTNLEPIVMY